ncbi:increased DNA methylation 3-like [Forsythia ovata]|uniref:Increased DNA methylation 3-like n=1 Tax=Forsythia ovata TaxID=205694 RepID=A0ABD1RNI6_9LAMI
MDTLDSEKMVKRIVRGRTRTKLDVDDLEKDSSKCQDHEEKSHDKDSLQVSAFPGASNLDKPYMMPLLPIPNVERYYLNASLILTGTACKGGTGPPVGAVDIGVSKSAYYFRISLPGVKKDPGQFSCEIERDGKVSIRGVTSTGVKTVSKYSRVFEMKFQQQCPPGPFTLCFSLPGPVDPRLFSPYFRSDGIFEAVVAKYE